jgi:protein phosphatase
MRGKMDCYGLTDVGQKQEVNEDQFLIADLNQSLLIRQTSLDQKDHSRLFGGSQGQLLLVADGRGSHASGRRASTLAVQALENYVLKASSWFFRPHEEEAHLERALKAALEECQRRIAAEASAHDERRRMGTTLTLTFVLWPRLYVVHAGDSRCYLFRGGRLEQITTDHTVARRLVDSGLLPPEGAESSRWSRVLWNCVGGGSGELRPEVYKATLQLGDTLLLCTDGLTTCLADEAIRAVLGDEQSAERTCARLVRAANDAGGPDNITVVVARFHDSRHLPLARQESSQAGATAGEGAVRPAFAPAPASNSAAFLLTGVHLGW